MKNFWSVIIFSFIKISIFTDRIVFRQKLVQKPINLPPFKTKLLGSNNVGKNKIDIIIIPEKKIVENIIFFNIIWKCYIKSDIFCLLLKIWILEPLINISNGLGLTL